MVRKASFLLVILMTTMCTTTNNHVAQDEMIVFRLVNQFRLSHGRPPLQYLSERQTEVYEWAKHLEVRYHHASRGYSCENIAINFTGPEELFNQWRNSPPHRRNMLLGNLKYCAVGIHVGIYKNTGPAFFGVFRGYNRKFKAD